jgi:hypothetical protein
MHSEIKSLWVAFLRVFRKEEVKFMQGRVAVETKFMVAAHRSRLDTYMEIKRTVEAAAYRNNTAANEAAVVLSWMIHTYHSVMHASMAEATALLSSMADDLLKPLYAWRVELLGLGDAVALLKERNKAFRDIYVTRAQNRSERDRDGNMKKIRPLVNQAFRNFTAALDAGSLYYSLSGNGEAAAMVDETIDVINGMIAQFTKNCIRSGSMHRKPGKAMDDAAVETEAAGVEELVLLLPEVGEEPGDQPD